MTQRFVHRRDPALPSVGRHLLITAPVSDGMSLTSQNRYWRLRAAGDNRVPGIAGFYDTNSLSRRATRPDRRQVHR